MIIYSFDCAIKNLGFCCIEVDNTWRDKTDILLKKINSFYDNIPEQKNVLIEQLSKIFKDADDIVSKQFVIKYINVFDLVPGDKVKSQKFTEILKRLKYVVYCLENQLPLPDIVLIENQMSVNDKANGISRYIEDHFTPIGIDINQDKILEKTNSMQALPHITYALSQYPLITIDVPKNQLSCLVYIVQPGLKNAYNIDPTEAGEYYRFEKKYVRLYDANKAHSIHHLRYFLKKFGLIHIIKNCPNKLDDISDSFMMAYAWCKQKNII